MFHDISHPKLILSPLPSVSWPAVPGGVLTKPILHTTQSVLVLGGGSYIQVVALGSRRHTIVATLFLAPWPPVRHPVDVCGGGIRPILMSIFVNLLICYAAIGDSYANWAKAQGDWR